MVSLARGLCAVLGYSQVVHLEVMGCWHLYRWQLDFFFLGIVCKIIHSLGSNINHLVRAHSIVTRVIFSEDYDCPYM